MKIAITGATGLIGREISSKLIARGDQLIILSRSPENAISIIPGAYKYICWPEGSPKLSDELNNVDAVIHLAGENVMGGRWNEKQKKKILESRTKTTRNLIDAISKSNTEIKTFISASAIGFYGSANNKVDENSLPGDDFLSDVVVEWEKAAAEVEKYSIRRVNIRIGIVLAKNGGALSPFTKTFKFFIGGKLGNGKQWFSWIHIDDLTNIFLYALDNAGVGGAINACAPNPVTMNEFTKKLGQIMKRPSFFTVPSVLLKLVLGERADLILGGVFVRSEKIRDLGFQFRFNDLDTALKDLLKS